METNQFNVLQLVARVHSRILLRPNMGHIAPIVGPIIDVRRELGAVEDVSMHSSAIDDSGQVIDPSLVRRMPIEVH